MIRSLTKRVANLFKPLPRHRHALALPSKPYLRQYAAQELPRPYGVYNVDEGGPK